MNIVFEYDPISFEEDNEASLSSIFGFEDYANTSSDLLNFNLKIENKIPDSLDSKEFKTIETSQDQCHKENIVKINNIDSKNSEENGRKLTNDHLENGSDDYSPQNNSLNANKIIDSNAQGEQLSSQNQNLAEEPVKDSSKGASTINRTRAKSTRSTKRRKRITVKKIQYKQRKDVLLKSILRKSRKFYQDSFTNFTRIKFLETTREEIFDNPDIFPNDFEGENCQQLSLDSLESFARNEYCGDNELEGLSIYIGCLISPRDFKSQLINRNIKLPSSVDKEAVIEYCQLVHEVLYKFSYQKLSRFINIPQFTNLFSHFCKFSDISDDCSSNQYVDLILSYVKPQQF